VETSDCPEKKEKKKATEQKNKQTNKQNLSADVLGYRLRKVARSSKQQAQNKSIIAF